MTNTNRNNRTAVAVIALLAVVVALLAILYPRIAAGSRETVSVRLPLIVTTLTTADGEAHTIQSVFDVKMDQRDKKSITTDALHYALSDFMAEMDYADISAPDGIDYINRQATEALKAYFPDVTSEATVYVYDFIVSEHIQFDEQPIQNDAMKRLFQNID